MIETGRKWWRGGVRGCGESAGYVTGIGAKVEDLWEVAFDVLEMGMSWSPLRLDWKVSHQQSLCQSPCHLFTEVVDPSAAFWIRCGAFSLQVFSMVIEDLEGCWSRRAGCILSSWMDLKPPSNGRSGQKRSQRGRLHRDLRRVRDGSLSTAIFMNCIMHDDPCSDRSFPTRQTYHYQS